MPGLLRELRAEDDPGQARFALQVANAARLRWRSTSFICCPGIDVDALQDSAR